MNQTESDFNSRVLCSDGTCIGVIGHDGVCKECGKPYMKPGKDLFLCNNEHCTGIMGSDGLCVECGKPRKEFKGNSKNTEGNEDEDWFKCKTCGFVAFGDDPAIAQNSKCLGCGNIMGEIPSLKQVNDMNHIFTCSNCGQKNRLDEDSDSSKAICAKCWTKLDVPIQNVESPPPPKEPFTASQTQNKTNTKKIWQSGWVWLLIIGGFFWWVTSSQDSNRIVSKKTPPPSSYSPPIQVPDYPAVPAPNNGTVQIYTSDERIAPFEIKTSSGANYLVKLVSTYSQQPVITIFVRGGNSVTLDVPIGTYEVKYASGTTWYGYKHLFGAETSYSKAESTFAFKNVGNRVSGYTITLYRVSNGNLRTSRINASQF